MGVTAKVIHSVLGVNLARVDTFSTVDPIYTREFVPGQRVEGGDNAIYVYGIAGGAITDGQVAYFDASFTATALTTTNGANKRGFQCGIALGAMSTGQGGWFQISGKCSVLCAAAVAVGTQLNTTATAGAVDDDATTGARVIEGLTLTTAASGAGAATGYASGLRIGATL